MREIGRIEFVQVQSDPLKATVDGVHIYLPTPLLHVESLKLTSDGIFGITTEGDEVIDAHHAHHPKSRHRGINGISLGFIHHYDAMRDRFGAHLVEGIAGENIIVRAFEDALPLNLGDTLYIRCQAGNLIQLDEVMVATPCNEFSRFCAGQDIQAAELKATLQFLGDGRRGYYATLNGPLCTIHPGDTLLSVD
ncbi:MAG: hypothetical protein CL607_13200 [Anaerolineaceae bacterium]|nr:hypothetical protein [Anaerolineaceae bacterium]